MKFVVTGWMIGLIVLVASCGDPSVGVGGKEFDRKIVIQGYLVAGEPVHILLTRNFAINQDIIINRFDLLIVDADVRLTDLDRSEEFLLSYNPATLQYEYAGSDLEIRQGVSYRLSVSAVVEGEELEASSVTTVPLEGFEILESESILGPFHHRERSGTGELLHYDIAFRRSSGIEFYVFSVQPMDASIYTFVYDNPFDDLDTNDVEFFFRELTIWFEWIQGLPLDPMAEPQINSKEIQWQGLNFYGPYRAIGYAGDRNMKEFYLTHSTVQEIDGNFHEPAFHITGDGIGVFGSAIVDTVFFEVLWD